ncbi:MAG TPA: antibiotic biosynthesis monooxygenase [Stellaceae bacterium]|nr:antibiotic biosynthesis monooxygenase [Stellaceae bacterium]
MTLVTQTRVREGMAEQFGQWQSTISAAAAEFPGFITQSVLPPNPPLQVDWVIQQRFANVDAASAWLRSERRTRLLDAGQPMLAGHDDVHLVRDSTTGVRPAPVSAVISSRVRPGQEAAFRAWEQRIAIAQAKSAGFQGYRFEPPIPGVQDDWLAILRFDTERNLQAWLDSPERKKLLQEAAPFLEEFHARVVRTGFEQWFPSAADGTSAPAVWKMNMLVLLLLYPIVFLFGAWVQTPLLMGKGGLPFWLALFIGNVVSVLLLNWLVPWTSRGFGWWLAPTRNAGGRTSLAGAGLIVLLYAGWLLLFSKL